VWLVEHHDVGAVTVPDRPHESALTSPTASRIVSIAPGRPRSSAVLRTGRSCSSPSGCRAKAGLLRTAAAHVGVSGRGATHPVFVSVVRPWMLGIPNMRCQACHRHDRADQLRGGLARSRLLGLGTWASRRRVITSLAIDRTAGHMAIVKAS
jgi:hypothetical protein